MKIIAGIIFAVLTLEQSKGDPFRGSGGNSFGGSFGGFSGSSGGFSGGFKPSSGGFSGGFSKQTSSFGSASGGYSGSTRSNSGGQSLQQAFTSTGVVPDDLAEVPPAPVTVITSAGKRLKPGERTKTSELDVLPTFEWQTEPGALYTLLIEDNNLSTRPDSQFGHLLVANIPGNDVRAGEAILGHIASFTFSQNEAKDKLDTQTLLNSYHVVLVYKQNGRIDIPEAEKDSVSKCEPQFFGNRFAYAHEDIQEKYNLEGPVAGTFYTLGYEPGWTEYWLCYAAAKIGQPIPFLLEGINDKEQGQCSACQKPRQYKSRWFYKRIPYLPLANRNKYN